MKRAIFLICVGLVAAGIAAASEATTIPPGLNVTYQEGRLGITAKEQSVREILEKVAQQAGFEMDNADLLPANRVSILLEPSPARAEIPRLLNLAPEVNFVVIYADEEDPSSPIRRVSLFPREGNPGVVSVTGGSAAGSMPYTPPPPPPPPPSFNESQAPVYIPPETPPVYIPPDEPPIYIPPESPPVYIPADGPPVYIPPAPPPGQDPPQ